MLGRVNDIHVAYQIISLTLHILLWNLPVGTSSCTASFKLLSPDFWLHLSFPSESLNLYIIVSSLHKQVAINSDYKLSESTRIVLILQLLPRCWRSYFLTSLTSARVTGECRLSRSSLSCEIGPSMCQR